MMQACLLAVHVESTVVLKIANLALILFSQNFLQQTSYKLQLTLLLKMGSYVLGRSHRYQHGDKRKKKKFKPLTIHVTFNFNLLNTELNPICYLLALLRAHHFLHVSRIRVKSLTFRLLMSYIYIYTHIYIYIYIWSTHS